MSNFIRDVKECVCEYWCSQTYNPYWPGEMLDFESDVDEIIDQVECLGEEI